MADSIPLVFDVINSTDEEKMTKVFCQEARSFFDGINGKIYAIPSLRKGRDMDLVVWMHFDKFKPTIKTGYINNPGTNEVKEFKSRIEKSVWFTSALLIIELKKHNTQDSIKIKNDKLYVKYSDKWHNASDQSFDQIHPLKSYLSGELEITEKQVPIIHNFIWLYRCIEKPLGYEDLDNIIFGKIDFKALLQQLCFLRPPVSFDEGRNISFNGCKAEIIPFMDDFFENLRKDKAIGLGSVTRKKLDTILKQTLNIDNNQKIKEIGDKLLIIKGKPGTGKTLHLLHLAYHLKKELYKPIILTYNKALVHDINRMIYYSGYENTVQIRTIHSFLFEIMNLFNINFDENQNFDAFETKFMELYELIKDEDFESLRNDLKLNFDTVLIDEAQDCYEIERDLIYKIFSKNNVVLSIGERQIVKPNKHTETNWLEGIYRKEVNIINLETSYRNKKDLVSYFNSFSESHYDLRPWELKENRNIAGGQIVILEHKNYTKGFHHELVNELKVKENSMYDLMFLTPSKTGNTDYSSELYSLLESWNIKAFNHLLDENKTKPFPIDEHRILNYKSCRGLEAWTLVCWNLDVIIKNIRSFYSPISKDNEIELHVNNWLLMIFTRAIDTLVITFNDMDSPEAKLIRDLAASNQFSHMTKIKEGF